MANKPEENNNNNDDNQGGVEEIKADTKESNQKMHTEDQKYHATRLKHNNNHKKEKVASIASDASHGNFAVGKSAGSDNGPRKYGGDSDGIYKIAIDTGLMVDGTNIDGIYYLLGIEGCKCTINDGNIGNDLPEIGGYDVEIIEKGGQSMFKRTFKKTKKKRSIENQQQI